MQNCLETCQKEHGKECWQSDSHLPQVPQELPTRVIDVSGQGDTVRLIETRSTSHEHRLLGKYCALSHAWGPPESETCPVTTTKKNLGEHCQGILISHLSKTFQEAIEITRSIGIDYLWIDSLCILQDKDDLTDWEREAKSMKSVYKNSYLTIAATGAKDGSQGCLFAYQREGLVSIPLWKGQDEKSPLFLQNAPPVKASYDWALGPLQDRAWITQEWILSPRLFHCCCTELMWRCAGAEMSECGRCYPLGGQILENANWAWHELVSQHTHRSVTKITDKLVAMQGIMDEMSEQFNTRFAFGISIYDLHGDLMWYTEKKQSEPQELADLGIPPWSWASLAGGVKYYTSYDTSCAFPGVDFVYQQSKNSILAHCRYPFPLEQTLSLLSADSRKIFLDEEDIEDLADEAEKVPIFIMPMIVGGLHKKVDEYESLLLTLVEPAASDTPAIFKRRGVALGWRGSAFTKLQDGHEGDYLDIIIR